MAKDEFKCKYCGDGFYTPIGYASHRCLAETIAKMRGTLPGRELGPRGSA